jgi:hypothetical protein
MRVIRGSMVFFLSFLAAIGAVVEKLRDEASIEGGKRVDDREVWEEREERKDCRRGDMMARMEEWDAIVRV